MQNFSSIVKVVKTAVSKHSPEILTGIGIAGMITTTVLAVRATPKAVQLIEAKKEELHQDELNAVDTVKAAWKCYIPAAVTGVVSSACLIGASSVHVRRNAALATAYKLSETALTEYKAKVVETIGEKKEQIIKDKVAEERVKNDPVSKTEVFVTEKGNTLCYDTISGRYFKSDIEALRRTENDLNERLFGEMYISLNEFYDAIGLSRTRIGDDLGWNIHWGQIKLEFSSQIADDGTPALVMDYRVAPKYDYYKLG